jgi:hypothetical protein
MTLCDFNSLSSIVAVHGLGGHPFKTWTDGSKLWLRDFLPSRLPQARIFTFGYDSRIAFSGSASEIKDFARQLLEALIAVRLKTRDNVSIPSVLN